MVLFVVEQGLFALVFLMWLTGESRIPMFTFAELSLIVVLQSGLTVEVAIKLALHSAFVWLS